MKNIIKIKEPIWKDRSVGISRYKLVPGVNFVEIEYIDKKGVKVFPHLYGMDKNKIMGYPKDYDKPFLHIVPIADFDVHISSLFLEA